MKKLHDLIGKAAPKKFRYRPEYSDIQLNWESIFGALSKDLDFGYVNDKCLVVYSVNPSWVNEISYYETAFLVKLNEYLPSKRYFLDKISVKLQRRKSKVIVKPKSKKVVVNKCLESNIKEKNKKRLSMGYKPCNKCAIVLTLNSDCVFCQTTGTR